MAANCGKITAISDPAHRLAQQYVDQLTADRRQTAVDNVEMRLPDWYDDAQFKYAQSLFPKNAYGLFMGTMVGMMSILAFPSIRSVLRHTKNSETGQLSYRRYLATMQHSLVWATAPLEPGSASWKSLNIVRKSHVLISRHSAQASSGIISQMDMAIVQYAMIGFVLNNPELYGMSTSTAQFDAFSHYWRVMGHMLGIGDQFNLFNGDREQNVLRLQLIQEQVFRPSLAAAACPDFLGLADAMAGGLAGVQPLLSPASFLYFVRMANGCDGYGDYWAGGDLKVQALNWWDRWLLFLQMSVHRVLVKRVWTQLLLNAWIGWLYLLITYVPVVAVWRFGWRRNYVRIMRGVK